MSVGRGHSRGRSLLAAALVVGSGAGAAVVADEAADRLAELVAATSDVKIETRSAEEYRSAAKSYRDLLLRLTSIDRQELGPAEATDAELLAAHLTARLYEIETLELHRLVPVRYFALSTTDGLFLRPCGAPDKKVGEAIEELERLPTILANAEKNLRRPAREWTLNAIYQAYYAKLLLTDYVPEACVRDAELKAKLVAAAEGALAAVGRYESWMQDVLLPRSDRSPAWKPSEIELYQFTHEQLHDYDVEEMLRIAGEEERALTAEMVELASRIHPSGDLTTVWELMKDEAPPWGEVLRMAQRYVELATDWLEGPGAHVVAIPDFDYRAVLTTPMARRTLSFGGAEYGPTVADRISGYYVLTPLEERLSDEEKASRIRSYNPYWTHVISYHEWLGHNVQRAYVATDRPMRKLFRSSYLSQAWSFYLEKLLEDEGYFEAALPHMEALKTKMARLQMRMWRVQRILTKLRMATGEMTFDEAVQAYIEKIGMEPTNAYIEVQRDSQSPSPPGREIIGERVILEMRDEYRRRMGDHYSLKEFHRRLLSYGELPLPVIARLMFGES